VQYIGVLRRRQAGWISISSLPDTKHVSFSIIHQPWERQLPLLTSGAPSTALSGTRARALEQRHQTMRTTLAWSEALLSAEDQRLFRRLAVFVGGFTLEAAQAVCAVPDG